MLLCLNFERKVHPWFVGLDLHVWWFRLGRQQEEITWIKAIPKVSHCKGKLLWMPKEGDLEESSIDVEKVSLLLWIGDGTSPLFRSDRLGTQSSTSRHSITWRRWPRRDVETRKLALWLQTDEFIRTWRRGLIVQVSRVSSSFWTKFRERLV